MLDEENEVKKELDAASAAPNAAEQEALDPTRDTNVNKPEESTPDLKETVEPTAEQEEAGESDNVGPAEETKEEPEPTLTQSQVNDLIGRTRTEAREKARQEALREFYERYGVNDDDELNGIFGKGQAYDVLNDSYNSQTAQYQSVMAENALLKSGVSESRWDDVKAVLQFKNMEINQDNILRELQTHPEWKSQGGVSSDPKEIGQTKPLTPGMAEDMVNTMPTETISDKAPSVMRRMGENSPEKAPEIGEDEQINKWFGLK